MFNATYLSRLIAGDLYFSIWIGLLSFVENSIPKFIYIESDRSRATPTCIRFHRNRALGYLNQTAIEAYGKCKNPAVIMLRFGESCIYEKSKEIVI